MVLRIDCEQGYALGYEKLAPLKLPGLAQATRTLDRVALLPTADRDSALLKENR